MKFDAYSLRARVLPAVIAVLPLIVLASLTVFSPVVGLVPAIGGFALAFWAAEFVRQRGLATERRLKGKWGGLPTTEELRFNSVGSDARRAVRRKALERATGQVLPSRAMEDADLDGANTEIEHVVNLGIARIRETKIESEQLQQENIAYGFRRNLRALKPLGLITVAVSVVISLLAAGGQVPLFGFIVVFDLIVFALWVAMVRDAWVRDQARKYSERYFIAIETIARSPSSTTN